MRLTVGACCALEDYAEQEFDQITVKAQQGRVTELRWLLWAALQPYHGEAFAAVDVVGELIDTTGGRAMAKATLVRLLTLNADDDPPKGDGKAQKDARSGTVWRRLYIDWLAAGHSGAQFWALSLCELWSERSAQRQKATQDHHAIVTQAWWIACLVWQNKLPDLSTLLADGAHKPARTQTWQEMKATMMALTERTQKGNIGGE